jgi:hypothetical protein
LVVLLNILTKKYPNDKIHYVEIGVKYGGVLKHVLDNTKDLNINVIGIDLFEDLNINDDSNTHKGDVANHHEMAQKFKDLGYNNVTLCKGYSHLEIEKLDKMEHVVCFIDGNHTYWNVNLDYTYMFL